METCPNLSAILPQIKDNNTKQIVSDTLKKLYSLFEETCAELTATIKRRKLTERDRSIKARLAKAKEQAKQPTVAEGRQHRTHSKEREIPPLPPTEAAEKVDTTVYIWYNIIIKYRRWHYG